MNVIATHRYAKISAFKAREVTREIQGLPVSAALDIVAFSPKKAAALIAKTLKSAIANAENNNNLRADSLVVREAVVGEGPTLKRFTPKARGSAGPIRKRTSHIRIIVTDEITLDTRESRNAAKPKSKKSGAKKSAARKQRLRHNNRMSRSRLNLKKKRSNQSLPKSRRRPKLLSLRSPKKARKRHPTTPANSHPRTKLWVKKLIQLVFVSRSIATGGRAGMLPRKSCLSCCIPMSRFASM